eukprot:1592910-Amphidinium_carterae.1
MHVLRAADADVSGVEYELVEDLDNAPLRTFHLVVRVATEQASLVWTRLGIWGCLGSPFGRRPSL